MNKLSRLVLTCLVPTSTVLWTACNSQPAAKPPADEPPAVTRRPPAAPTPAPAPALAPDAAPVAVAAHPLSPDAGRAEPPKPAAPALEVKPPTAADLPAYLEGIKGKGPLQVQFDTTLGKINCELAEKEAPMTVANFVGLARGRKAFLNGRSGVADKRPFFDGLIFHRVIPGFMIQGGDPLGTGTGNPGYKFAGEFHPTLKHDKPGILSMANAGPNTNGSQFFITEVPTPQLDGGYNVFGRCKEIDVIRAIARVPKDTLDGSNSRPRTPVVMKKVTIHR